MLRAASIAWWAGDHAARADAPMARRSARTFLKRAAYRTAWRAFELWNSLDTTGSISGRQLGYKDDHFGYQPIDYETFVAALRPIDEQCRGGVFVDFGCGKGRALLLASFRSFRRVIGVEQSAILCDIARTNLERSAAWRRAAYVHVVQQDAAQFTVPDDANLLFFYNPFQGAVLNRVVEQIRQSYLRSPRPLNIIYALPRTDHDALGACDWLMPWRQVRTTNSSWQRLTIYRPRSQ